MPIGVVFSGNVASLKRALKLWPFLFSACECLCKLDARKIIIFEQIFVARLKSLTSDVVNGNGKAY